MSDKEEISVPTIYAQGKYWIPAEEGQRLIDESFARGAQKFRSALERIAEYPATRDRELSMAQARQIARDALALQRIVSRQRAME